jgi:hypothetical protein
LASPLKNSTAKIEIRAVDNEYYSTSEIKYINIGFTDNIPPIISMINPTSDTIKLYQ